MSDTHHITATTSPAPALTRDDLAKIAQAETHLLGVLRAAVARRSGDANAATLHDGAAAAFHQLFAAAGAYDRG